MRAVLVLPLVPVRWIAPVAALRLAEQVEQGGDAFLGRVDPALAPPAGHLGLDLAQQGCVFLRLGDHDGPVYGCRRAPLCVGELGQTRVGSGSAQGGLDADDVGLGRSQPVTHLGDDGLGRLAGELDVAELARVGAALLLGGGQVLGQPRPLGGDVDGAGQVELDRHPGRRWSATQWSRTRRRGSCRRSSDADRAALAPTPQPVTSRRHPLGRLDALIGPEPPHLGDDRLQRGDLGAPRPRRRATGRQPARPRSRPTRRR